MFFCLFDLIGFLLNLQFATASCYHSKGAKCLDCVVFEIICADEDDRHSLKKKPCSLTPLVIFIRACLQCKFFPNLSCNPAGAKTQEKSKKRESVIACNNQSFLFEWSHYSIIINYTCLHESKGAHLLWYSELAKARPVQL